MRFLYVTMISIQNINYTTATGAVLLDMVHCTIQPGKITSVMGANGAGKSTLLKIISNEIKATKGNIYWDNTDISHIKPETLAKKRSVLRQQYQLTLPFTVYQIIEMGRYPYFKSKATQRCIEVINEVAVYVGVSHLLDRNYLTLSGGEQQRVHLARVLAQVWDAPQRQKLIILDEPVSALDIYYQHHLLALVKKIAQEEHFTIITVIHDINLALQYSDDVLLLKSGKQIAFGDTLSVLTQENIYNTFNIYADFISNGDSNNRYVTFRHSLSDHFLTNKSLQTN